MEKAARQPWLKPLVFAAALSPLLWLVSRAVRGTLGPDPVAEVLNRLGLYAITLLFCSLACTPLQIVLGWSWPLRVRRMLGLFAFFYACLHLSTYVFLDQGFDFTGIGKDIAKRRFVTVGFAAWCALVPLAVTSTQAWVKRLGFRRWKSLHRLAYLAGALACGGGGGVGAACTGVAHCGQTVESSGMEAPHLKQNIHTSLGFHRSFSVVGVP